MSSDVLKGFRQFGLDPSGVRRLFALVRETDCIAIYYKGDQSIKYLYRRQGLGAFNFVWHEHPSAKDEALSAYHE